MAGVAALVSSMKLMKSPGSAEELLKITIQSRLGDAENAGFSAIFQRWIYQLPFVRRTDDVFTYV